MCVSNQNDFIFKAFGVPKANSIINQEGEKALLRQIRDFLNKNPKAEDHLKRQIPEIAGLARKWKGDGDRPELRQEIAEIISDISPFLADLLAEQQQMDS